MDLYINFITFDGFVHKQIVFLYSDLRGILFQLFLFKIYFNFRYFNKNILYLHIKLKLDFIFAYLIKNVLYSCVFN